MGFTTILNKQTIGVSMSIYIDSYNIKIEGEDHEAKGKEKPIVTKMNMSSKDGMNSKTS